MSTHDSADAPYGLTANGRPIPGGFSGTIPAFLDWLDEHLAYGGVSIGDPEPHEFIPGRKVRKIRLVTGGYSDDEALLGRVASGSMFWLSYWESTHRGGLYVYEIPVERFDSPQELEWLEPPTDVFESVHRAREVIVKTAQGDEFSIDVPHGARLLFSEPDRDIVEPAGVLTVEPITEEDSVWKRFAAQQPPATEVDG